MVSAPRFTILMPTHYRPDVIFYAIESVLAQTIGDFELLVVGDGADPATARVVQGFTDPRVRWFDFPKAPGYGYANRNRAMVESRGELIAYAADDDIMLPDHLEQLSAPFADPGLVWAYSRALWVSGDGIAAPDLTNLHLADERQFLETVSNTISGGSMMFRATAFPTRQCWPEHVLKAADWEMMKFLLRQHGPERMAHVRTPTYLHFVAGQKTRRDSHFPLLGGWLGLAGAAAWWPRELQATAEENGTLQAAYLNRLQSDPACLARLRAAVDTVIDRAALDHLNPRTGGGRGALEQHGSALDDLADARRQLELMRTSTSWRLTHPLRALIRTLRRDRD